MLNLPEAVSSLKLASQMAGTLIKAPELVANAELQVHLAHITGALSEAMLAVQAAEAEVARLNESLQLKGDFEKRGDAYFLKRSDGVAQGDPYCVYCWEVEHRPVHLTGSASQNIRAQVCPHCKHEVRGLRILNPK